MHALLNFLAAALCYLVFAQLGSLFLCGLYVITRPGRIFGFWSRYWEEKYPDYLDCEQALAHDRSMQEAYMRSGDVALAELYVKDRAQKEAIMASMRDAGIAYKRPALLVHPLSGCIYCYASLYGSLFFWGAGAALTRLAGLAVPLGWPLVGLWLAYCVTLSALNGINIKKVL